MNLQVLVAYATKYGATAGIAERIGASCPDASSDRVVPLPVRCRRYGGRIVNLAQAENRPDSRRVR